MGGLIRVEDRIAGFRFAGSRNKTEDVMKKLILILGAATALILAGCDQGGTSDAYNTTNGNGSSAPSHGTNHSNTTP